MEYDKIYIADRGIYGGGGEALYQLGCDLIDKGYHVDIAYLKEGTFRPPSKFQKYIDHGLGVLSKSQIIDEPGNLLIVPESITAILFQFHHVGKMIWWLSFNYYDGRLSWNSQACIGESIYNLKRHVFFRSIDMADNFTNYRSFRYPLG